MLRLTGLYLALSTLAFASIMDKMLFQADFAFGFNGTLDAERLSILGRSISSTGGYVFVMAVFFVVMACCCCCVRRGVVGRMLIAMRDSPAACGTLGLDMRWFRVGLFAVVRRHGRPRRRALRRACGRASARPSSRSSPACRCCCSRSSLGVTSVTGAALGGIGLMLL